MSESKLVKGILVGALAGAVYALFDKNTRTTTVDCMKQSSDKVKEYFQNPSDAVHDLRLKYENVAQAVNTRSEQAIQLLDQLNEFLEKVDNEKPVE